MIGRRWRTNSFRFSRNASASSECFATDTGLRLCERDFLTSLGEGAPFGEEVTADLDRAEDLGLVRSWLDSRSGFVCESPSPRIAASAARLAPRFGLEELRSGEILDFRGMRSKELAENHNDM